MAKTLHEAFGGGLGGAMIRLVIRNKQKEKKKIPIFRKDKHSQQSKK